MPSLSTRRTRVLALVLVLGCVLPLAACGSPPPRVAAAPGVRPGRCGTLTLAVNPWVGYEANAAVVAHLAREELGCRVVLRREGEVDSWKHLASGEVDAILENWGHDDLKKLYIDERRVAVEAGLTGNKGVIGWYVPPWMVERYPDITDWRTLNTYASLFRTPSSGDKGQLLDGDPSYVTNDKALVRNLDLDFQVTYAGSEEALISAFRTAEREHTPLLGYFYSPQWFLSEVKLAHVTLPPYTPGCDADPARVACDYQPYDLDKIENRDFAYSGSPAARLIQNFQWSTEDQNLVARDIASRKLTPEQAARRWVDTHRSVWAKWFTGVPRPPDR